MLALQEKEELVYKCMFDAYRFLGRNSLDLKLTLANSHKLGNSKGISCARLYELDNAAETAAYNEQLSSILPDVQNVRAEVLHKVVSALDCCDLQGAGKLRRSLLAEGWSAAQLDGIWKEAIATLNAKRAEEAANPQLPDLMRRIATKFNIQLPVAREHAEETLTVIWSHFASKVWMWPPKYTAWSDKTYFKLCRLLGFSDKAIKTAKRREQEIARAKRKELDEKWRNRWILEISTQYFAAKRPDWDCVRKAIVKEMRQDNYSFKAGNRMATQASNILRVHFKKVLQDGYWLLDVLRYMRIHDLVPGATMFTNAVKAAVDAGADEVSILNWFKERLKLENS